ncbi:MAG: hypothetical protein L6R42_000650 [Xanthoria sp. 1 TBL-2021]|nr:MAG: hypothetical protein L6R42_000650 [Xanthoria sp. 1 TBL-2021]
MSEMGNGERSLARQAFRIIYILILILTASIRIPFLLLSTIPKSLRPHPTWSYRQALFNALTKIFFNLLGKIKSRTPRSLDGGAQADLFSVVDPAPAHMYQKPLSDSRVQPTRIGGIWVPARYDRNNDEDGWVVLHFHGGAYVTLSPRLPTAQYGPKLLCKELPATAVFCPQYRLASSTNGTFPAALQDALTAYRYMLEDQGIAASRLIISGDSSGGHLAISLLRYLNQHRGLLPLPAAALLHSPWLDLTEIGTRVDANRHASTDYLSTSLLQWGAQSFIPNDISAETAYVSPLKHPFAAGVPLWLQVGSEEVFYDQILEFFDGMKRFKDNDCELYTVKYGMHDVFAVGGDFGMEDQARNAVLAARSFLERKKSREEEATAC